MGGDDDIKALYFPMALETVPLAWFDKLRPGSITCWEDLQGKFYDNFAPHSPEYSDGAQKLPTTPQ